MDKNEVDKTILEAERFLAKNRPVDIERLKAKRRVLAGAYLRDVIPGFNGIVVEDLPKALQPKKRAPQDAAFGVPGVKMVGTISGAEYIVLEGGRYKEGGTKKIVPPGHYWHKAYQKLFKFDHSDRAARRAEMQTRFVPIPGLERR